MVRSITEATRLEAEKNYNRPIELHLIFLDPWIHPDTGLEVGGTLYLATWPHDIEFYDENGGAQTYTAAAIHRRELFRGKTMEVDRYELEIDNVDRSMSAYLAHTNLQGRRVMLWKIFLDDEGEPKGGFADRIAIFSGYIDTPQVTEYSLTLQVVSSLDAMDIVVPRRLYTNSCAWVFGDPDTCGIVVPEQSGTIASIFVNGRVIGLTEGVDHVRWTNGTLRAGGVVRNIISTNIGENTVKLEHPLPHGIEVGDSYVMKAGCDKTDSAPYGCLAWNNTDYYGGFRQIPKVRNVREIGR